METKQSKELELFLLEKPRGPKTGDSVQYTTERGTFMMFQVVGSVVWAFEDKQHEVGLVWGGRCEVCDAEFFQSTAIRPHALVEACPTHNDGPSWRLDGFAVMEAQDTVSGVVRSRRTSTDVGRLVKRRGRMEGFVLEVMRRCDAGHGTTVGELVDKATELLPEPEEGQRDTRRQRVIRALQQLVKEKDGPIDVRGAHVVLVREAAAQPEVV